MRILQIGLSGTYGGVEAFVMNCLRQMRQEGILFDAVDLYGNGIACGEQILQAGGRIYTLPNFKKHPLRSCRRLVTLLKSGGYAAVHIHMLSAANLLPLWACRKAGIEPVIHAHNTQTDGPLRNILHRLNLQSVRRCPGVRLACCREAGQWLHGERDFLVIPNAIETERFAFDARARAALREQLGIGETVTALGFVGRLTPVKNPMFLLRLLKRLKEQGEFCLILVGEGVMEKRLRAAAVRWGLRDRVIFAGARQDVGRWLSAMDLFLLPSLFEGLSFSAVEAQCNGLKCLVSDVNTPSLDLTGLVRFLPVGRIGLWEKAVLQAAREENGRTAWSGYLAKTVFDIRNGANILKTVYRSCAPRLETLVVAVGQSHDLLERMNIQTDAVVGNQCGRDSREEFRFRGYRAIFHNSSARGVGKNRNAVLEQARGQICILADVDMRFLDGYDKIMEQAVAMAPDADVWLFNLIKARKDGYEHTRRMRIGYCNYQRYGASRMVLRRSSVVQAGLWFDLRFGGGAPYGAGEDTLFLKACLDRGLKIVAVPLCLAEMDQTADSTWFRGYDRKFFMDKGALYRALDPWLAPFLCLRFAVKYSGTYRAEYGSVQAFRTMLQGAYAFNDRQLRKKLAQVGILTFPHAASHGAALQMYALYSAVEALGYDVRIINYQNRFMQRGKHKAAALWWRMLGGVLHGRMYRAFHRFENRLRFAPRRTIHTGWGLCRLGGRFDSVICGSDQVWNPEITGGDTAFFLPFCDSSIRRIAYAPSFGVAALKDSFAREAAAELRYFDALSVRESEGAVLAERLAGKKAETVADPIFLLSANQWRQLLGPVRQDRPYVLYYTVRPADKLWDFCRELAKRRGWKILAVGGNRIARRMNRDQNVEIVPDLGPEQWLTLLDGAACVVTNSFHGTAFSIRLQKDFYVELPSRCSSRLEELLESLRLSSRVVRDGCCADTGPVDYTQPEGLLKKLTDASWQFLKKALEQERK